MENDRCSDARSKNQNISLKIYDISGRLVRHFSLPTAYFLVPTVISWYGDNQQGHQVPAGVYFVELSDNEEKYVKKTIKIGGGQ